MNIVELIGIANLCKSETYITIEQADKLGYLQTDCIPENETIRLEAFELLSKEAKEVLKTLLYSTDELEKLVSKGRGRKTLTLRKLKKFFKTKGLGWRDIKLILAELRMYLIYLESK